MGVLEPEGELTNPDGDPELACVVLSVNNHPGLPAAVKSLVTQDVPVEIVVVNSGGGDPLTTLKAHVLAVKVVSCEQLLYPGAARNIGIDETRAPHVAFLAADCVAEAGWARERLKRHKSGALAVSSSMTNSHPYNSFAIAAHLLMFCRRLPRTPSEKCLHFGVSYTRELFRRFGKFDKHLRAGEDSAFNASIRGEVEFVWAPEVRCQHSNPTSLSTLLQDQFERGARKAHFFTQLTGRPRRREAWDAFIRLPDKLRLYWLAATPAERARLIGVLPWLLPAASAYALGALVGRTDVDQADELRSRAPNTSSRAPRILALLQFHNEMLYLPDYFRNVGVHVDGIIALDDGSTDGSGDFVREQPNVLELMRLPVRQSHVWDEPLNQRMLITAALRHEADWILVVDADERLERNFRTRALDEIRQAEAYGKLVLNIRLLELWNQPDTYRDDGPWGQKKVARLFKARKDHEFSNRTLHGHWAPLNSMQPETVVDANLLIYHLRMIDDQGRRARKHRYQSLDPNKQWQSAGYDYLTDETGIKLRKLEHGRDYKPKPK